MHLWRQWWLQKLQRPIIRVIYYLIVNTAAVFTWKSAYTTMFLWQCMFLWRSTYTTMLLWHYMFNVFFISINYCDLFILYIIINLVISVYKYYPLALIIVITVTNTAECVKCNLLHVNINAIIKMSSSESRGQEEAACTTSSGLHEHYSELFTWMAGVILKCCSLTTVTAIT